MVDDANAASYIHGSLDSCDRQEPEIAGTYRWHPWISRFRLVVRKFSYLKLPECLGSVADSSISLAQPLRRVHCPLLGKGSYWKLKFESLSAF